MELLGRLNPSTELCRPLECLLLGLPSGSSALRKTLTKGPKKKKVLIHLRFLVTGSGKLMLHMETYVVVG